MNKEFLKAARGQDWLSWLGQPMLYDGALCVTRSTEELIERNKWYKVSLEV